MNNPYESSTPAANGALLLRARGQPSFPVLRGGLSAVLIAVGGMFLILLNGQVFTNSLVFMALVAGSVAIWLPVAVHSRRWRTLAYWILLGHAAALIATSGGLPKAYERQSRFNSVSK